MYSGARYLTEQALVRRGKQAMFDRRLLRAFSVVLLLSTGEVSAQSDEAYTKAQQKVLQLYHNKQYSDALDAAQSLRKMAEKRHGPRNPVPALVLTLIGAIYHAQGANKDAEMAYLQALSILQTSELTEPASIKNTLKGLGKLYIEQGRSVELVTHYERSIANIKAYRGASALGTSDLITEFARVQVALGRYSDAEASLRQVIAALRKAKVQAHRLRRCSRKARPPRRGRKDQS
jgi:tetratricopeptide (TPR) repeat protein